MKGRYSSISLKALRRSRTVLSRETDAETGRSTWVAELSGTGLRGRGATRTEALRRVREEARAQQLPIAGASRQPSSRGGSDGIGTAA